MARNKIKNLLLLIIQILITVIYEAAMIHMTIVLFQTKREAFFTGFIGYLAQFIILIVSFIPQLVLRVKKKIHSQDGEIYPLLFTMISLQSTLVIPMYQSITGIFFIDTNILLILLRFSLLGTAAMFLLSSLRFYGFASSRLPLYTMLIMGSVLLFCIVAPKNIISFDLILFSSRYDAYLQLTSLLLYLATITTMIITAIKDKTATNIKRCISFSMLIIGIYLSLSNALIPTIFATLFYITGIILLVSSTQESF